MPETSETAGSPSQMQPSRQERPRPLRVLLAGGASYLLVNHDTFPPILTVVPSVALASGLLDSFDGIFPGMALISLAGWTIIGVTAATRWFKFAD